MDVMHRCTNSVRMAKSWFHGPPQKRRRHMHFIWLRLSKVIMSALCPDTSKGADAHSTWMNRGRSGRVGCRRQPGQRATLSGDWSVRRHFFARPVSASDVLDDRSHPAATIAGAAVSVPPSRKNFHTTFTYPGSRKHREVPNRYTYAATSARRSRGSTRLRAMLETRRGRCTCTRRSRTRAEPGSGSGISRRRRRW